jgi:hypothetical protein
MQGMNNTYAALEPLRAEIDALEGPVVVELARPGAVTAVLLNPLLPRPSPHTRPSAISRSKMAKADRLAVPSE